MKKSFAGEWTNGSLEGLDSSEFQEGMERIACKKQFTR